LSNHLFILTNKDFTEFISPKTYLNLFFFYSFIHMCIHCLGHFSILPLSLTLSPPNLKLLMSRSLLTLLWLQTHIFFIYSYKSWSFLVTDEKSSNQKFLGGGNKEEHWKGWIQVWYMWYIIRSFVNGTIYSHPAQQ
jgi:hypothetical protein